MDYLTLFASVLDNLSARGHGGRVRELKVWWILRQLGNADQTGQVLQIGAFIVELDQGVVLGIVALLQKNQSLRVVGAYSSDNMNGVSLG